MGVWLPFLYRIGGAGVGPADDAYAVDVAIVDTWDVSLSTVDLWNIVPSIPDLWNVTLQVTRWKSSQMKHQYETVRLKGTFTDEDGDAVDPNTVILAVTAPDGTVTTYTYGVESVVKSATGIYYYDMLPSSSGTHTYHWKGVGSSITVIESSEFVAYAVPSELA